MSENEEKTVNGFYSRQRFIKILHENPVELQKYAEFLCLKAEDIVLVAFNDENFYILVTLTSGEKVLYHCEAGNQWDLFRHGLPKEFQFMGFQHTEEGISFDAYAKIS